jgi:hypothetical protein
MSAPETELVTALTEHAGLAALIDGRVSDWPVPQDTARPCCGYYLVTTPRTQGIDGAAHERLPRFTVRVSAESPESRAEVAEQVAAALEAIPGAVEVVDEGRDVPDPTGGLYERDIDVRFLR